VAIDLEQDEEDARIMLTRAVECVPESVELWLALARLETHENARKVLNQARLACPASRDIWIAAAKLEEAAANSNDSERIDKIVNRAVRDLTGRGVAVSREEWIKEAEQCEMASSLLTTRAIIKETIGLGLEAEDRKRTWMDDAENALSGGHIATARAIYTHALGVFPTKKSLWLAAAYLEKNHGTRDSLDQLLQRAVILCPKAEVLWLMAAKEQWLGGNLLQARRILQEAFKVNPNSEQIVLAAVKLESETGEFERARGLLGRARQQADTPRVWMKSVTLENYLGDIEQAKEYLHVALQKYPKFDKLWMIKGQIAEREHDVATARSAYKEGVSIIFSQN
jgi:pre-mRNA-processing factor 6